MKRLLLGLAVLLSGPLASCGGDDEGENNGTTGMATGTLSIFTPGVASAPKPPSAMARKIAAAMSEKMSAGRVPIPETRGPETPISNTVRPSFDFPARAAEVERPRPGQDFVPGEVIVSLREGAFEELASLDRRMPELAAYRFTVGVFGGPDVLTVRVADAVHGHRSISHEETERIREALARHPALRYADLNYYKWTLRVPNDPFYQSQWHYPQMNLPAAWDITTGSGNVVVGIIDDGVNDHPDLSRRIQGYDMISELAYSGDGDGRDADPRQVPNAAGTQSIWHGTHVAGTVGASSDNGSGLAGVDWACQILPVRVLGVSVPNAGAGTSIDIIAGINWAVGVEVPGTPVNSTPANVINLSLGGGSLIQAEQDALDAAAARGAIVVVAAGNSNTDSGQTSLGGYNNVINVGAVDYSGRRAPYSNYGQSVDVMAPGGNVEVDANADRYPDGVLSTYLDQAGQMTGFDFLQGTSMASPHVAGVAALMKSVNPNLNQAEAEMILRQTANPGAQCNEGCGAGLVNAAAAINLAKGGADPGAPPSISLSAERLNLGGADSAQISIFNGGGSQLTWSASLTGAQAGNLSIQGATSGQLGASEAAGLAISVNRAGLGDGDYQGLLVVQSDAGEARAAVLFRVGAARVEDVGTIAIATVQIDENEQVMVGGESQTNAMNGFAYSITSKPGQWFVFALADRNGNEVLDQGDYWGLYRTFDDVGAVSVEAGGTASGINFGMVPYGDLNQVGGAPCTDYRTCIEGCAGDAGCEDQCPVSQECQTCFGNLVGQCGDTIEAICQNCEPGMEQCFGPLVCSGIGGGQTGQTSPVGGACDGQVVLCAQPYGCDTSVAGGYCTRDCAADAQCPDGGLCVGLDTDMDGTDDAFFCFADCTGSGACPRAQDSCVDLGGAAVCAPP